MRDVGEREGEVLRDFAENTLSEWTAFLKRRSQRTRLAGIHRRRFARENGRGILLRRGAYLFVHGPAGTAFFHDGSVTIQSHMADFRFTEFRAVEDLSIHHQKIQDAIEPIGGIDYAAIL